MDLSELSALCMACPALNTLVLDIPFDLKIFDRMDEGIIFSRLEFIGVRTVTASFHTSTTPELGDLYMIDSVVWALRQRLPRLARVYASEKEPTGLAKDIVKLINTRRDCAREGRDDYSLAHKLRFSLMREALEA